MDINNDLIKKLERLAKLNLAPEEKEIIRQDLSNILKMVDVIKNVDTNNVPPLQHVNEDVNVWRQDKVENQISNEEALKNAPSKDGPYISVPKVIDL